MMESYAEMVMKQKKEKKVPERRQESEEERRCKFSVNFCYGIFAL